MKWAVNISLFVGIETGYVALLAAALRTQPEIALTMLGFALVFTIPFLPIYLGLVAALPDQWTARRRRAMTVAMGPLLITPFVLFAFAGGAGVSLLVLALPGPLTYGALVRLPHGETSPASPSGDGHADASRPVL